MKPRRIGILTGGGDAPGLNAVIRVVAKSLLRRFQTRIFGILDGFEGLVEGRFRELTYDDVSGIFTRGGTILGTSNRADPFRFRGERDRSDDAVKNYRKLRLDGLIVIGGEGTLQIASRLSQKGVRIVGVPKTIDNDVWGTEVTFGFNTAVTTAAGAIEAIHTTADSHRRIMIVEVMGRYAGWIGLYAGVAGGSDVILIPEIPFEFQKIADFIRDRHRTRRFTIVTVSEGAIPAGGGQVISRLVKDSPDTVRLGGIGNVVGRELERRTGCETRVTILGHLLRSGSPTPFDRLLAGQFGLAAAEFIAGGRWGEMVAMRRNRIVGVRLHRMAGRVRPVPPDDPMIRIARAVGTHLGD